MAMMVDVSFHDTQLQLGHLQHQRTWLWLISQVAGFGVKDWNGNEEFVQKHVCFRASMPRHHVLQKTHITYSDIFYIKSRLKTLKYALKYSLHVSMGVVSGKPRYNTHACWLWRQVR